MRVLLFISLIFYALGIYAQQNPLQNQYLFDLVYVNAAYTGHDKNLAASALLRKQWVGFTGAPEQFNFAVHSPLKNDNIGIGIQAGYERIGPRTVTTAAALFAYRVKLSGESRLHFGLRAAALNNQFNWDKIEYRDEQDMIRTRGSESVLLPNFDFGVMATGTQYFVGFEIANLTQSKLRDIEESDARQFIHARLTGGWVAKISDKVSLKPNTLIRYAVNSPLQIDLNLNALFAERLWIGAGYRFNYGMLAMVQFRLTQNFDLGYAYDFALNPMKTHHTGSHEVFLSYRFNVFKSNLSSPRYF
jgi:type IX secretion system PorP/SprF family membrane protein